MWTHCVSAVQFLQKGVVCAFGEATLLIDKSQHAQLLKGDKQRSREGETHHSHDGTSYNLIGTHLAAFIAGNRIGVIEISPLFIETGFSEQAQCLAATIYFAFVYVQFNKSY